MAFFCFRNSKKEVKGKKMAGIAKLNNIIAPAVEGLGYEFVGLEYKPSSHQSMLRIFIDHENGINVDDCARVSRQVSAVMDVEDPIKNEYTLEVSSPGLDRPLFTVEHYQRFKGEKIKCKLRMPFNGRRNFTGKLLEADERTITLSIDDESVELYIDDIEKAHIVA
jgi:ribosome maturation factor RimP